MYFQVLPVLVCSSIETSRHDLSRKRKISCFLFPLFIVFILKPQVYTIRSFLLPDLIWFMCIFIVSKEFCVHLSEGLCPVETKGLKLEFPAHISVPLVSQCVKQLWCSWVQSGAWQGFAGASLEK